MGTEHLQAESQPKPSSRAEVRELENRIESKRMEMEQSRRRIESFSRQFKKDASSVESLAQSQISAFGLEMSPEEREHLMFLLSTFGEAEREYKQLLEQKLRFNEYSGSIQ